MLSHTVWQAYKCLFLEDPYEVVQRISQLLGRLAVPAMLEEATSVPGRDHRDRRAQRLDQGLPGTGLYFSQDALDLRQRLAMRLTQSARSLWNTVLDKIHYLRAWIF